MGFLFTGILEVYIARGRFWETILYYVMILAALFGIVSSMFVNKDPWVSIILNSVSVHLFALEAISIIIHRFQKMQKEERKIQAKTVTQKDVQEEQYQQEDDDDDDDDDEYRTCCGLRLITWLVLGDFSFFIGTSGDVVLSYFYIFEEDYIEQAIAATVTASFWLLASLIYLGVSSYEHHKNKQLRLLPDGQDSQERTRENRERQFVIMLIICIMSILVVLGIVFGVTASESEEDAFSVPSSGDGDDDGSNCTMTMQNFTESTMMMTMTVVSSTISAVEIQYAASVFEKTYVAMLHNELDGFKATYCDPHCREVTGVRITSGQSADTLFDGNSTAGEDEDASSNATATTAGCDSEIYLTMVLEGYWWGCADEEFPGLFSDFAGGNNNTANIFDDGSNGTTVTAEARNGGDGRRFLQDVSGIEEYYCPVCSANSSSLTNITAPSPEELVAAMSPYMTVLPSVCELTSITIVDDVEDEI
jgi:uncharacterized membrane protein YhaH (DUF805 family)